MRIKQTVGLLTILLSALLMQNVMAELLTKTVQYKIGDKQFESTLVYEATDTTKRPGVVMVPNWLGPTEAALADAKKIAAKGYVVLMTDMYGVDIRPKNMDEAGVAAKTVRDDRHMMRERINQALTMLKAQADTSPLDINKLAAVGYCFGGGTVLELARSGADIAGVVSFHGNLDTPNLADAKQIKAKILVLHGANDPYVPPEQVDTFTKEMRDAKTDWQLVSFGGAVHSFSDPLANMEGAHYNEKVATRAYLMMDNFFAEIFPK
ncbi:dienelactone hydrolase family protein [Beggiatoa leptomitoformis]|uniref:Prolyl oligopeptidase family serine peptidase n=1 Tax=Beggiatoa leptomitoformis TaxID=288004 RepID=A0A2N9YJJ7_9GAMM|nr:dienelactone hydrolase family protein [Beggiatoa leptomitoformis]ALG69433.2 prolyl oligopeptidase family serine peptidase [Beggiatoa leptomitoformis]AUI70649.2 prolyl oligopeptidase family serine peptidase [Beggiatoa leptomitoformis]